MTKVRQLCQSIFWNPKLEVKLLRVVATAVCSYKFTFHICPCGLHRQFRTSE